MADPRGFHGMTYAEVARSTRSSLHCAENVITELWRQEPRPHRLEVCALGHLLGALASIEEQLRRLEHAAPATPSNHQAAGERNPRC